MRAKRKDVTLIVYGWEGNQPGTMSWVFPSFSAAVRSVRALRNAVQWLIVRGARVAGGRFDVEELRRHGGVLAERMA